MKVTETQAQAIARTVLRPSVQAAQTVRVFNGKREDLRLAELVDELAQQAELTNAGDLTRMEAMLTTQAHTLDAIFHTLARRAADNIGQYMQAADTYMRLALKAQSQTRATVETLATMKNPPVVFAKQANIAHGHQQVNNASAEPLAREEIKSPPTKVLEHADEAQRLDKGTTRRAGAGNPPLEAVAAIYRPPYASRKGSR